MIIVIIPVSVGYAALQHAHYQFPSNIGISVQYTARRDVRPEHRSQEPKKGKYWCRPEQKCVNHAQFSAPFYPIFPWLLIVPPLQHFACLATREPPLISYLHTFQRFLQQPQCASPFTWSSRQRDSFGPKSFYLKIDSRAHSFPTPFRPSNQWSIVRCARFQPSQPPEARPASTTSTPTTSPTNYRSHHFSPPRALPPCRGGRAASSVKNKNSCYCFFLLLLLCSVLFTLSINSTLLFSSPPFPLPYLFSAWCNAHCGLFACLMTISSTPATAYINRGPSPRHHHYHHASSWSALLKRAPFKKSFKTNKPFRHPEKCPQPYQPTRRSDEAEEDVLSMSIRLPDARRLYTIQSIQGNNKYWEPRAEQRQTNRAHVEGANERSQRLFNNSRRWWWNTHWQTCTQQCTSHLHDIHPHCKNRTTIQFELDEIIVAIDWKALTSGIRPDKYNRWVAPMRCVVCSWLAGFTQR